MRKMSVAWGLLLVACMVPLQVRAGLNNPVLTNSGFEDPAMTLGEKRSGINGWYDSVSYTYTQNDGSTNHPDTPYGDNWAEFGLERWMYQQIGTYEEGLSLDVTLLAGSRWDNASLPFKVYLWVGGDPALAADVNSKFYAAGNPLESVVGATMLDCWTVPALDSSGAMEEVTAYVGTYTGHTVGEPLWLQIVVDSASSGRLLIDNVDVALGSGPPPPFDAALVVDMYNNPDNYTDSDFANMVDTVLADTSLYGTSPWYAAWNILEPVVSTISPTPSNPYTTSSAVGAAQLGAALITWESRALLDVKMADLFEHRTALPVDPAAPRVLRNRTLNVTAESHATIFIDTGLYAAPGEVVTVEVPSELVDIGMNVCVGHGVDEKTRYKDNKEFYQMPYLKRKFSIDSSSMSVGNVHGGLIMFEAPRSVLGITNAQVSIDGAVETPHFILGETTDSEWVNGIRDRGTPWGVIESDRCKAIWDSRWLKTLDNPEAVAQIRRDMTWYEEDLYGPIPTRPLRLHADYHGVRGVSSFPQYKYPDNNSLLDLEYLQLRGDPLLFHEYGHILDLGAVWKWDGFAETANNWASAYMGHNYYDYERVVPPLRRARQFDLVVSQVTDLMASGDRLYLQEKLSMMTMMGDHFGWQSCRNTIHYIQALSPDAYDTNQKRMDLWLTSLGTEFGYDVSPLMERWQWTFSDTAKAAVSHLPPFSAIEQTKFNVVVPADSSVTFESPLSLGYSYDGVKTLDSIGSPSHGQLVDNGDGTYTYTPDLAYTGPDAISYTLRNGLDNTFTDTIDLMVLAEEDVPLMEVGHTRAGTAGWTTVELDNLYDSMVVVAQPVLGAGQVPLVTRIRNASSGRFEICLQRTDGLTDPVSDVTIEYLAVEEGVYHPDTYGIRMEATKFNSTVTDHAMSWEGEVRDYAFGSGADHYRQPSVFGQVMSFNDPDWSAFWSCSIYDKKKKAAIGPGFVAGRHVGEDPDTTRANETVGYVVIDSGFTSQYQVGDLRFQVSSLVEGFSKKDHRLSSDVATYEFDMMPAATHGIIQASGLGGGDQGYWSVLEGPEPFSNSTVKARIVEDQLGSVEQNHGMMNGYFIAFVAPLHDRGVGLVNPAVSIASFEDPAMTLGENSSGINGWYDSVKYTLTQNDDTATHPDTPYGDNWAELGQERWMYQRIGTYRENMDLDISFLTGRRSDNPGLDMVVNLLVGGDATLAADVDNKIFTNNPLTNKVGGVGADLIAASGVISKPAEALGMAEQSVQLSTGTGYAEGEPLWLQIAVVESASGRLLIDNVKVADVTDGDADGMVDAWEKIYFHEGTATLPDGNPDGDAHGNLEEYIAGMNPTNKNSFLSITNQHFADDGFVVNWPAVSGRLYRVSWAESITNSFQTLVDDVEFPRNSFTDTVHHVEGGGYYKIDVRLK
ncbi:M60 family metallopeptidase [Verrucomicrobiota bacterium]